MPLLLVKTGTFRSSGDEAAFFRWLGSIPGVGEIVGTPAGLQVSLKATAPSDLALRELIALYWRYQLPMKDLCAFKTAKNARWFCQPGMYWYEAIFGDEQLPPESQA